MSDYKIKETKQIKALRSKKYNYNFDKVSGFFMRWGEKPEDDPDWCEFGPEIADIEISTVCNGLNNKPCKFCYKSNTGHGENMDLETFQKVFNKLPTSVCQIALGIGDIHANPDLYNIMQYCREFGVIPNVTVNGWNLSGLDYHNLAKLCGAVAVSRYDPPEVCYSAVYELNRAGLKQVNIHQLLCEETFESCMSLLDEVKSNKKLAGLKSVVFLALKQCGRGKNLTPISLDHYQELVEKAFKNNVSIGFDSCSAPMFLRTATNMLVNTPSLMSPEKFKMIEALVEPCESTLFSAYIDVKGNFYPCSFCEQKFTGISVIDCEDFLDDIWNHPKVNGWRSKLLDTKYDGLVEGCRQCPEYQVWG